MRSSGQVWWVLPAVLAGGLLLLAACKDGGGGDDGTAGPDTSSPTPSAGSSATPDGGGPTTYGPPDCEGDPGAPQTGAAADDLQGIIVFVRLASSCQPEVYSMNADGSGARNLSNNDALDDEPDLSPDGKKVVFFSGRRGTADIYVMNIDGSDVTQLTEDGGNTSPRWSPDGSRIAFSHGGSLELMDADGSGRQTIMQAQSSKTAEDCHAGSIVGGWSPDGERIVYYAAILAGGEQSRFWLCTITADGSDVDVIVDEDGELHAEPHWSPDGRRVVYREQDGDCSTTGTTSCNYEVYMLDLESGDVTNLTDDPALDIEPTWSSDGEWIVFGSNRGGGNFDLYAIHPDGSGLQKLLDDQGAKDSYPTWVIP
jgi:Tol biopolymer transport system component